MKYLFISFFICLFYVPTHAQVVRLDVEGSAKIQGDLELADADSSLHIGIQAGAANVAKGNTFIGTLSGMFNNTGASNTFLGHSSGFGNTTGSSNTFIGEDAGKENTIGSSNTFIGENAGRSNVDKTSNTYIGTNAGINSFGGNKNTFVGQDAGFDTTLGDLNTFLGENAGKSNTTGDGNTFIGQNAAVTSTTGDHNTALGAAVSFSVPTLLNATALGYAAVVDAPNKVVVGNNAVTTIGGFSSWTTFPSDGRMKTKIKENVGGLDFILQLRPVTYKVDALKLAKKLYPAPADTLLTGSFLEGLKKQAENVQTGFIAQEVAQAAKKSKFQFSGVVSPVNENGTYGLKYAEFTVPLVQAMQEFHKEYEQLQEDFQQVVVEKEILQEEVAALKAAVQEIQLQLSKGKQTSTSGAATTSYLKTLSPNPFSQQATLDFFVPAQIRTATLHISTVDGRVLRTIPITARGKGQLQIDRQQLAGGTYVYSLELDGQVVGGQKMIIQY